MTLNDNDYISMRDLSDVKDVEEILKIVVF